MKLHASIPPIETLVRDLHDVNRDHILMGVLVVQTHPFTPSLPLVLPLDTRPEVSEWMPHWLALREQDLDRYRIAIGNVYGVPIPKGIDVIPVPFLERERERFPSVARRYDFALQQELDIVTQRLSDPRLKTV